MVLGPVLTSANGTITTGMTRGSGGGSSPIIKAKWEMNGPYASLLGTDNSTAAGAQFLPPGVWDGTKKFSICAIVTDPEGIADIDGVYTDWYYPETIAFHPEDPAHPDVTNGGAGNPDDYGLGGCGLQNGDENQLTKLTKTNGYNLFCNTIRNNNNNLPTFFPNPVGGYFSYDEICGETGELQKETAFVYCADKELIWEDPAGEYRVQVLALDKGGNFSYEEVPDENFFEYLPLTAFEVDFTSVAYGSVQLNTHKIISGDKTFGTATKPTVRNTGNTRLYMHVEQDDMGLGTTDGQWNVRYDGRVGNNEADWKNYYPDVKKKLQDILDLSETEEMDFSIKIFKFPSLKSDWTGQMWLSATKADFRQCYDN
jgi:hypothetical protein